jgi:hypothetical protein
MSMTTRILKRPQNSHFAAGFAKRLMRQPFITIYSFIQRNKLNKITMYFLNQYTVNFLTLTVDLLFNLPESELIKFKCTYSPEV